jgi:polysaccharide chain length determinant protein (PEP-CTERM system associated)
MHQAGDFFSTFRRILSSIYRRKGLVVSVFLVISSLASYLATILPDVYRSSTLIRFTQPRVPTTLVGSTVTHPRYLRERIQSTIQEFLSTTQLERTIQEFNRLPSNATAGLEGSIGDLRKSITVESRREPNVFGLSFESKNPEQAKQVTSRLASLFIGQNLREREQQAQETKSFINAEAERLRKELEEQEAVVNRYKAANRFELPEQLDTNLRSLEQLRRELEANNLRLAALQDRKGGLQKQTVESDILGMDVLPGGSLAGQGNGATQVVQIQMKRKELDSLLQRYSTKHPDVVQLQREIQALETESGGTIPTKSVKSTKVSGGNPLKEVLQTQLADIDLESQTLRSQSERVRNQINVLQTRVDNTSVRAIELSKISRGYEITLRKYQDLLAKGLESGLSESVEKQQKGEQFQIVEPANFPVKPVRPNRLMIVLLGLAAGLAGGVGLAVLWETLDTSFKKGDEINAFVNLPLLATLPALVTRGSVLEQRRAHGLLAVASIGTLAVGIVCVRILGPMYF